MLATALGQPQETCEPRTRLITAKQLPLTCSLQPVLVCDWGIFKNDLSVVGVVTQASGC